MRKLFASMKNNDLEYEVCIFRNHLFRLYPNGYIAKVNDADIDAAKSFGHIK